jgi:hypothetical protein
MSSTLNNLKKSPPSDWGSIPKLTPEQTIQWLESYRKLMFEIWKSNPSLREQWEIINQPAYCKLKWDKK